MDAGIEERIERAEFRRLVGAAAGMAIMGMIVFALYALRDILMPLTLATLLSFVLAPMVRRLTRLGLPRGFAAPAVTLAAFAGLALIGYVFVAQVRELAVELPTYRLTLRQKIVDLRGRAAEKGALTGAFDMIESLVGELNGARGTSAQAIPQSSAEPAPASAPPPAVVAPDPVPVELIDRRTPLQALTALATPLLHPLATTALIVVFVAFILAQREDLRNRFVKLVGGRDLPRTTAALDDAAERLSRLFATQLALNAGFGVVIGVGLWLIGVPNPILWGGLATTLRFVPYIGAAMSAALPLALAVAVDPGWSMAAMVAALFLVAEPLVGHVIEPLLLGRTTGLSPVAIVVSATLWTWLWGPVGLVLATPLTVCLVVLGKHIEGLRFIDMLLGDQPALSGPEAFYQQMLVGDPIEAASRIAAIEGLDELARHYDEVTLAGLRLAQRDLDRDSLDPARARRVRSTVEEMFEEIGEDLAEGGDGEPVKGRLRPQDLDESWRGATPVVAVAGRGPLDQAAAAPAVDLAARMGLAARALPFEALRGASESDAELAQARLVILSFLDPTAQTAMRFAARRVRHKAPKAQIVLALWDEADSALDRARLKAATHVDAVALSAAEARRLILMSAVTGLASGDLDEEALPGAPAPAA